MLKIDNRTERIAKQQAFITLKDHKENFTNKPTCRLINKAKSEIGIVSKKILEKINNSVRQQTSLNQWKNSTAVINWFTNITEKQKHSFAVFDIESFNLPLHIKKPTDKRNKLRQEIHQHPDTRVASWWDYSS